MGDWIDNDKINLEVERLRLEPPIYLMARVGDVDEELYVTATDPRLRGTRVREIHLLNPSSKLVEGPISSKEIADILATDEGGYYQIAEPETYWSANVSSHSPSKTYAIVHSMHGVSFDSLIKSLKTTICWQGMKFSIILCGIPADHTKVDLKTYRTIYWKMNLQKTLTSRI